MWFYRAYRFQLLPPTAVISMDIMTLSLVIFIAFDIQTYATLDFNIQFILAVKVKRNFIGKNMQIYILSYRQRCP